MKEVNLVKDFPRVKYSSLKSLLARRIDKKCLRCKEVNELSKVYCTKCNFYDFW